MQRMPLARLGLLSFLSPSLSFSVFFFINFASLALERSLMNNIDFPAE